MADPGFPVGGRRPRTGGDMDSLGGYVLKMLYVKRKESGPLGGVHQARPLDPPMILPYAHSYVYTSVFVNRVLFKSCTVLEMDRMRSRLLSGIYLTAHLKIILIKIMEHELVVIVLLQIYKFM